MLVHAGDISTAAAAAAGPDADVPAARAILDGWQAEDAEPGERLLHVIDWRTKDREFPAEQQARLDRIMTHIQDFYRREMERHGFGPRSIRLDRDAAGTLVVHDVVGEGGCFPAPPSPPATWHGPRSIPCYSRTACAACRRWVADGFLDASLSRNGPKLLSSAGGQSYLAQKSR